MSDHSGPATDPIRVLIVDDHALFRRGLIQVLQFEDGIEVVGEAEDGEDAIAKSEEHAPDVLLMDVRMPRISGIEATRRLAETMPTMKILMLTVSDEEDDLYEAIKAGATGSLYNIAVDQRLNHTTEVVQGVRAEECSEMLTDFFMARRRPPV